MGKRMLPSAPSRSVDRDSGSALTSSRPSFHESAREMRATGSTVNSMMRLSARFGSAAAELRGRDDRDVRALFGRASASSTIHVSLTGGAASPASRFERRVAVAVVVVDVASIVVAPFFLLLRKLRAAAVGDSGERA